MPGPTYAVPTVALARFGAVYRASLATAARAVYLETPRRTQLEGRIYGSQQLAARASVLIFDAVGNAIDLPGKYARIACKSGR